MIKLNSECGLLVRPVEHLAGNPLCDLDQLPQDGVVGALQRLDSYLLWHGALLDARFQQPVAIPKQIPSCQIMGTEGENEKSTHWNDHIYLVENVFQNTEWMNEWIIILTIQKMRTKCLPTDLHKPYLVC